MNIFKRFWKWLKEDNRKQDLQTAVQIVQNVKHAVEGKLIADLVHVIPIKGLDLLRHRLIIILTEVLHALNLVQKGQINNEALKQAIEVLRTFPKKERKAYYDSISGKITSELTKLPIETATILANKYYMEEFIDETNPHS